MALQTKKIPNLPKLTVQTHQPMPWVWVGCGSFKPDPHLHTPWVSHTHAFPYEAQLGYMYEALLGYVHEVLLGYAYEAPFSYAYEAHSTMHMKPHFTMHMKPPIPIGLFVSRNGFMSLF